MRLPRILVVALSAVLAFAGCASVAPAPDASPSAVPVGDSVHAVGDRTFRIHRPADLPEAAPLVLVLHGGFGSGEQAQDAYGWDALADAEGFVVAYPDGQRKAWNAGGGCCGLPGNAGTDDVGFLEDVIDAVAAGIPLDERRIAAAGMSNGAMMAYRLACDADRLSAVVAVAGTIVGDCPDPSPVSVLAIHGIADTTVRMDGGAGDGAVEVDGMPVPDVVAAWRAVDGCAASAIASAPPVTRDTAACADGREVDLVTIADAGHQWPGSTQTPGQQLLGADPPSTAIDATAEAWAFVAAHPAATGS